VRGGLYHTVESDASNIDVVPTCGAKGTRTPGLLDANQTLFQLSYSPEMFSKVTCCAPVRARPCKDEA
jgi:hypothetical protein